MARPKGHFPVLILSRTFCGRQCKIRAASAADMISLKVHHHLSVFLGHPSSAYKTGFLCTAPASGAHPAASPGHGSHAYWPPSTPESASSAAGYPSPCGAPSGRDEAAGLHRYNPAENSLPAQCDAGCPVWPHPRRSPTELLCYTPHHSSSGTEESFLSVHYNSLVITYLYHYEMCYTFSVDTVISD